VSENSSDMMVHKLRDLRWHTLEVLAIINGVGSAWGDEIGRLRDVATEIGSIEVSIDNEITERRAHDKVKGRDPS